MTSVITPSAKIDLAPFTSTKWREAAERAGLTGKMWPASTKIGLEAVMGTKWREAAERVAGMAEVRAKTSPASTKIGLEAVMGTKWREAAERAAGIGSIAQSEAAARTPIRADAGPEVLAALIALAWFATLVGYWLDELNRQGVSLAEVGRFELLAGVAFMIETTRWVYLRAVRILRQH